jgi:hypothetical protein
MMTRGHDAEQAGCKFGTRPRINNVSLCMLVASSAGAATTAEPHSLAATVAAVTQAAELPSCPGGSFPAVFGQWLALGLLSRRRVLALAEAAAEVRFSLFNMSLHLDLNLRVSLLFHPLLWPPPGIL